MHFSTTTTLPLLSALTTLITAQQSTVANGCQTFEPSAAYQIFSGAPDLTQSITDPFYDGGGGNSSTKYNRLPTDRNSAPINKKLMIPHHPRGRPPLTTTTNKSRRHANVPFTFYVSQDESHTDNADLVVVFKGLPCDGPGPFSFEFNFQPSTAYVAKGVGQINVFRVDTDDLGDEPTYNTVDPITGSLIGTFELPRGGSDEKEEPVLIFINQLVCKREIVLRFGISRYEAGGGSVMYGNTNGMGLRERNGC